jgi:hypothetical protein
VHLRCACRISKKVTLLLASRLCAGVTAEAPGGGSGRGSMADNEERVHAKGDVEKRLIEGRAEEAGEPAALARVSQQKDDVVCLGVSKKMTARRL